MATISTFEEVLSWQEARELNKTIGKLIDASKFKNNFRLINQIEGSAGSIMDNIAEGFERGGNREFIQFLYISKGSCGELRSQLYRALDRNYITQDEFENIAKHSRQISSLIQKLINYLEKSSLKGKKYKDREYKGQGEERTKLNELIEPVKLIEHL
jgi:four helix bundle protein